MILFFPSLDLIPDNINPKSRPDKPERPLSDYDDSDLEEDCLVCGKQNGVHTRSDICNCMSNGEKQYV